MLLAQELLMHDALADRSRVMYDPYTPEQQQGVRRQLEKFVAAQVTYNRRTHAQRSQPIPSHSRCMN